MHNEIEVKLEIQDPPMVKRRLRQLGFRAVRGRRFERNRLFDFADGRLRKAGWVLRLRFVDGGRYFLTLKCGAVASPRYKIRREVETEIKDGERVATILQMLGLGETFRYERHRTLYECKGFEESRGSRQLAYDETPLGDFIELEGPQRWIDTTARHLGYERADYITFGYPTLYSKWNRGKIPPGSLLPRGRRRRWA